MNTGEADVKQRAIMGFTNGCCAAFAGEISSASLTAYHNGKDMNGRRDQFRIIAGVTKARRFLIYNMDQVVLWKAEQLSGNIPLFMQDSPLGLEWNRPVKIVYVPMSERCKALINHLENTYSENIRQKAKDEDPMLSVS